MPVVLGTRARARATAVVVALLAAGALVAGTLTPAAADRRDDVDRQLEDAGEALDAADAQVTAAMRSLTDAKEKLPAAQSALTRATAKADRAAEADRIAAAELRAATSAALRAEQQLAAQEAEIADMREQVGNLARAAYLQGPFAEINILLDARDPGDFTSRLAALDSVGRANSESLARMSEARAEMAIQEVRLELLREEVDAKRRLVAQRYAEAKDARAEAEAAKAEVDRLVAQRRDALAVAEEKKDAVKERYDQLAAEQARLAEEARRAAAAAAAALRAQAAARSSSGSSGSAGSSGASTPSGSLVWPVSGGGVSGGVGPRIHPVYGYRSCHTGVDISAGYGTPIRAAASGIVASVQNGGPYGLHTLIVHSGGLSTMYAHQSSVAVGSGSSVSAGQVIGYVGSTGWSTGPHLHFEVHVGGVPYDPFGWFGGSRYPVSC